MEFIKNRENAGKDIKHLNHVYNIPVMTAQEENINFFILEKIECKEDEILVSYSPIEINNETKTSLPTGIKIKRQMSQSKLF